MMTQRRSDLAPGACRFPHSWKLLINLGYANAAIDDDGVFDGRCSQRSVQDQTFQFPYCRWSGASLYLNKTPDVLAAERGRSILADVSLCISWGTNIPIRIIPTPMFCQAKFPPARLPAKSFSSGLPATGTFDHYPTPMSKFMPGVEFHANVIDNLIATNTLKLPRTSNVTYIAILGLGLFCGLVVRAVFRLGWARRVLRLVSPCLGISGCRRSGCLRRQESA